MPWLAVPVTFLPPKLPLSNSLLASLDQPVWLITAPDFRITALDICMCTCRQHVRSPSTHTSLYVTAVCHAHWKHRHATVCDCPAWLAHCRALHGAGSPRLPVILYAISITINFTIQSYIPPFAPVSWGQNTYNTLVTGHDVCAPQSPAFMLMWLMTKANAPGYTVITVSCFNSRVRCSHSRVRCGNSGVPCGN